MNLQEQISRIQSMMGLNEAKEQKIQSVIDMGLDSLRSICKNMNSEEDEYVSFQACQLLDSGVKIVVNSIDKKEDELIIIVDVSYYGWHHLDEDPLMFELQDKIKVWVGKNRIKVNKYINTYPEDLRNW